MNAIKLMSFVGIMAFAGCSTQLGHFAVYSPKSLDLSKPQYVVDRSKKVKGVDPATLYLVFPSRMISYDQAVRNAMAKQPGCIGLAEVTIHREAFWLLFGYCDFYAEGYPIVVKKGVK